MNRPTPPVTAADLATEEEEFHSSYRIFINAVEMLATRPEEQVAAMGSYNVAWELKEDVAAGKYLLARGFLNESEESWVYVLACALESVNALVLPAGSDREANLHAMQHSRWEPLRFLASEVLLRLAAFTSHNAQYLGLQNHAT